MAKPLSPPTDAQPKGPATGRLGRLMDRIVDALGHIEAGTPADRALREIFKRSKDLGSRERNQVKDAVYGVLRSKRRLDDRLIRGAKAERRDFSVLDAPVQYRMRVLAHLANQGADLKTLEATDRYAFRRIPKLFDRLVNDRIPPAKKRSPLETLAVDLSLPSWMADRLINAFGEERTTTLARALDGRAPVTLRIDPKKTTRAEAQARIHDEHGLETTETRLSPHGLILPHAIDLKNWPMFQEGWVELQDEGSQLIALATGAQPNMAVLDACAGAGGKTLALASMIPGGHLVAIDEDKRKLSELTRRADRHGVRVETHALELETLPKKLHGQFDVVLVDAPCTGTGTLRRAPDVRWRLEEKHLTRDVHRQKRLLASAFLALKPGGTLVYATCSILHEENEAITQYLIETEPRIEPRPLAEAWGESLSIALAATHEARIGPGPHDLGPDGFYVARFVRID